MENKFKFFEILKQVQLLKQTLPKVLANQAQNFFLNSFKIQGWDDGGLQPWEEVKRRQEGTPENKYPKNKGLSRKTSPILVRSGALRRAVGMSTRVVSFQEIKLVVSLPYAAAQNDGNPKKNVHARKFMGNSATLRKMQLAKINEACKNLFE